MAIGDRLEAVLDRVRPVDPYHYECTVCERVFPAERSTCTVCGGEVERVRRGATSTGVDPSP